LLLIAFVSKPVPKNLRENQLADPVSPVIRGE
jgi:hypothetical protein